MPTAAFRFRSPMPIIRMLSAWIVLLSMAPCGCSSSSSILTLESRLPSLGTRLLVRTGSGLGFAKASSTSIRLVISSWPILPSKTIPIVLSKRHQWVCVEEFLTSSQSLFKVSWCSIHSDQGPDDRVKLLPMLLASMISYSLNRRALAVGVHSADSPGKEGRLEEGGLEEGGLEEWWVGRQQTLENSTWAPVNW